MTSYLFCKSNQLWLFPCPKGGYSIPVAIVEPISANANMADQKVYVACGKWIYCLHARTGILEWSKSVSNMLQFFGGYVIEHHSIIILFLFLACEFLT